MDLIKTLDDERLNNDTAQLFPRTFYHSLRAALERIEVILPSAQLYNKVRAECDALRGQLCRARTRLDHMYHVCNMSPQEIAEADKDIFGVSPCPHEARVKQLEDVLKEDEEIERTRSIPIFEWTEEEMKDSLETTDDKVWSIFIEMSKRQLRYHKNELEKILLRDDVLTQYVFHVRLKIKELEVIISKDVELRRRAKRGGGLVK